MTTFALIGAGPGLGLATARRFGIAGHAVALIARNAERLEEMTTEPARDGIQARGFTADVLDIESLTAPVRGRDRPGVHRDPPLQPGARADFMKQLGDGHLPCLPHGPDRFHGQPGGHRPRHALRRRRAHPHLGVEHLRLQHGYRRRFADRR